MVSLRTRLGIYLLFLAVYLTTGAGHFLSVNHVVIYRTTQSLVERGSLALSQELIDTWIGPDGQRYGAVSLGQVVALAPLYVVGHVVDGVSPPAVQRYFIGAQRGVFGGEVPIYFVSLFNQLVMPLVCLLVFLLSLRLGVPRAPALLTTLAFGVGTAAWAYAHDNFPHPLEALLLTVAVYLLVTRRDALDARLAVLVGSVFAALVLTRVVLLAVGPALWLYLLWAARRAEGQAARQSSSLTYRAGLTAALWLPTLVVLAVILYLNGVRFGNPLTFNPLAQANGFATPLWVGLYGNLLSVGRSIFLYSPPLLLALAGWPVFWRRRRAEALLSLSLVAVILLIYSVYTEWDGGWAWGPRYLVPIVPLLIIPLGFALTSVWRLALLFVLTALGVAVQGLGIVVNYDRVHTEWLAMKLEPATAYLFVPGISAIPTHLTALLEGRHIDLRLLEVYRLFGPGALLATLLVPVALGAGGAWLLARGWHVDAARKQG